uniref:PLOD1-3-like GT domain-containing protein n=1 Tax=viral metagenome TaxID=1070528 RepID=A0A6C0B6P4_9ZZZZ
MRNRLHYITVATKPHEVLNRIKARIEKQGESITILGAQENRSIGWNATGNFGVKLKEVRDFVLRSSVLDNDIVLFTDAYDVLYFGNHEEIVKRYLEFNRPIVFGCETTCNPVPSYEKYYTYKDCEFPYLNSGLFIGRAWALQQYISQYQYIDKDDDQVFWTERFLTHMSSNHFALDYNNSIFLNTYGIDLSLVKRVEDGYEYKGARPIFIHVNGPDKTDLQHFTN